MNIARAIFKAYDIRGIVGETLDEAVAENIGRAIGSESIRRGERGVVVGRDGRPSGAALVRGLKNGLIKSGCHVVDIGICPTPVLYYAAHAKGATSGVMVTGSHNPPQYNGFKMMIAGATLAGEQIAALHQRIQKRDFTTGAGTSTRADVIPDYRAEIQADIHLEKKMRIVVDCGNGAAATVLPELYTALGVEVEPLFCAVDGNFPNHHPDPSKTENLHDLIDKISATNADLGFAFDGDGDRLGLVDNCGKIIWADRQMMIYARDILSRNPGAKIVFDVKCSALLAREIKARGGVAVMTKTGHSLIKAKMRESGALLGGEMSGHIFFKERWYGFDDAIYAGARLLEILSRSQKTVAEMFAEIPEYCATPELNIHFEKDGEQFKAMEKLKKTLNFADGKITVIDGFRIDFKNGWGLVRPSNTTPSLVLRFEAVDENHLRAIQNRFAKWLDAAKIPHRF